MSWQAEIRRRPLIAGLIGLFGLGAVGGAYEAVRLFGRGEDAGAYGDLVSRLSDPDSAATVGSAVIAGLPKFDATRTARDLRRVFAARNLEVAATADLAEGRILEAEGWVLPESLALVCALAAAGRA